MKLGTRLCQNCDAPMGPRSSLWTWNRTNFRLRVSRTLQEAYDALSAKHCDAAIQGFEQALTSYPSGVAIHKDLAYTLLKIGENDRAREHFAEDMKWIRLMSTSLWNMPFCHLNRGRRPWRGEFLTAPSDAWS